jgi:ribose transport system substrate-binding protein
MNRRVRNGLAALLTLAVLVSAAACGSGSSSDKAATTGTGSATSSADSAKYDALLADAYKGNFGKLPTSGPPAAKNKKVWVISCGEQVDSCAQGASGAYEGAKALGWDVTLYDGKLNPANYSTGISQAVAAGADGLLLDLIDCNLATAAMKEAKKAGVKLVGYFAFDCNDPNIGGEPLFDARPVMRGTQDYDKVLRGWTDLQANMIIAKTQGKAKIIQMQQDELLVLKYGRVGFEKQIAETCPGCEIVATVKTKGTDFGPKLQQMVQTAILQHPEANVVYGLYDGLISSGVGAAVVASGRNDELFVMGGEGFKVNADLVRQGRGEQDAGVGFPNAWAGYAAADTLNRVFQGQQPAESGIGFQAYDAEHNLPPSGMWVPVGADGKPQDFRGAYKKIWAGGK